MAPYVIYHGNCLDGFTAAWAVWRRFPGATFYAGHYGSPPPPSAEYEGRDVVIVDFSYDPEVLDGIACFARSVLVLDHHKTAAAALSGFAVAQDTWTDHRIWARTEERQDRTDPAVIFDMERSGARLAWDYFFATLHVPAIIRYVEDRDLWRFSLPESRAYNAAYGSYPMDMQTWDRLAERTERAFPNLLAEGEAILRQHDLNLASLLRSTRREMTIGGVRVPVANLPPNMASDGAGQLARGAPFAASYYDTREGRAFSLRSTPDGLDVSEIAKRYGGGGHRNAAGMFRPRGWEGDE